MKVYLAGGFYSDWRESVKDALRSKPGTEAYDPEHDGSQHASYAFVHGDLEAIDRADLVIAYYPRGYDPAGMAAEMGYAAALKIPVYYIDTTGVPDMFLTGLSKRLFTSIGVFADWWKQREEKGRPLP